MFLLLLDSHLEREPLRLTRRLESVFNLCPGPERLPLRTRVQHR